jgi:hypothetical protein
MRGECIGFATSCLMIPSPQCCNAKTLSKWQHAMTVKVAIGKEQSHHAAWRLGQSGNHSSLDVHLYVPMPMTGSTASPLFLLDTIIL